MGSRKIEIKVEITVKLSKKSRKVLKCLLERLTPSDFILQPTNGEVIVSNLPTEEKVLRKTVTSTLSTTEQKEEKKAKTTAIQGKSETTEEKTKKDKKSGKRAKRSKAAKRKEASKSEVQPGEQSAFDLDFDEEVMALKEENDD